MDWRWGLQELIHFDSVVKRGERVFSMEIFKNRHGNRMDKWRAGHVLFTTEKCVDEPILDGLKDRNLKDYV